MSVFYPPELIETARRNARAYPWAAKARERLVAAARPWRRLSDEALWRLMFGPTIRRSWMVWSNGYCPACRRAVTMYHWEIDALKHPWKVRCPYCREFFPKNDFARFYASGLDERGVFDPRRADRSLLFHADHPDPADPHHRFGVDDGEGYVEGERRWRFIGAYLIYGQWKQAVLGGIRALVGAYVVTGERLYARKAAILLDRVADLYPEFDFGKQGVMYEGPPRAGYVSTWHDACEETRELALAYDAIRSQIEGDRLLVAFLRRKAKEHGLENPKASAADIRRNIEDRILRHALEHRDRIYSNYPRTEITLATIQTVLGWPQNRTEVYETLDPVIEKATAVDGVTGEKGLAGYTAFATQGLAMLLATYARIDPRFLPDVFARHPRLRETFRFHIDTWCLGRYYPQSGDSGAFARPVDRYVGVSFSRTAGLEPSMFTFLWQVYEQTGDAALVQALYHANGGSVADLPHDLFAPDPERFQRAVAEVIEREGPTPVVGSVNKRQWRLAILRGGKGAVARALWLDYDSGGGHGHRDGLNLGLFAWGLDLLPDFGYPPVQYGGWGAPRAVWYTKTAAHNTVVVDGKDQAPGEGECTLWADGEAFRAVRASAPALIGGAQYERTAAMIDASEADFYVVDLFRVIGGVDHALFVHSHFGRLLTDELLLEPAAEYGHGTLMRQFHKVVRSTSRSPSASQRGEGRRIDWEIEDRYGLLPRGAQRRLRYLDLTRDAHLFIAEAWISEGFSLENREAWIPRLLVRRQAETAPLASTFVGVLLPYERSPAVAAARRLPLTTADGTPLPEANVAVEITLADGRRDLLLAADRENPLKHRPDWRADRTLVQPDQRARLVGELAWVRREAGTTGNGDGALRRLALCHARSLTVDDLSLRLKEEVPFLELRIEEDGRGQPRAVIVAGDPAAIEWLTLGGVPIPR